MAADEGWQQQGLRRKGKRQQRELTDEVENLSINNSGRGRGRGGSNNGRGNSRSRGGSPAGYGGNTGGQRGHPRDPGDKRGYQGGQYPTQGDPARRGGATSGVRNGDIEVHLQANYFEVDIENATNFYRYRLPVETPDGVSGISRRVKQRIVHLLTEELKRYERSVPVAPNYHDILVSVQPLPILEFPHTINIKYFDEDE